MLELIKANSWVLATLVIPVVIAAFKAELGKLITTWAAYKRKAFQVGDRVQLHNGATGEWAAVVTVKEYVWSLSSERRGVYITYPDGGVEKVGILAWQSWRKRPEVTVL